jgi:predicted kinase
MNQNKVLIILRAAPNAGKTTFANYINWLAGDCGEVLSADDYFTNKETGEYNYDVSKIKDAHNSCRDSFINGIINNVSPIIIANTNQREWEFQFYLDKAEEFGYSIVSLVIENRHGNKNSHNAPLEKIEAMAENIKNSLKLI